MVVVADAVVLGLRVDVVVVDVVVVVDDVVLGLAVVVVVADTVCIRTGCCCC